MKIKIYCNTFRSVTLYACQIWLPILREELCLSVFENRVLWKIIGPMRYKVTAKWRRRQNEEIYGLYTSQKCYVGDQMKNEISGSHRENGGRPGAYRVHLVGKPLGRPRRGWEMTLNGIWKK